MSKGWLFLIIESAMTFRIILHSFKAVSNIYSNYVLTVLTTIMHYWFFFLKKGIFSSLVAGLSAKVLWKITNSSKNCLYKAEEYLQR